MATSKVQPLNIILGIKGAEKLAALKSSFRDLTKTVKQTDVDIEAARKSVNEYAKSANQSQAVIKGQIKAFEGLREQAAMGGEVYRDLSNDIADLKAKLAGSTPAIEAQRKALLEIGKSSKSSATEIRSAILSLKDLSKEAVKDSEAFIGLKKDTRELVEALAALEEQSKKQRQLSNLLNGTLRKSASLISLQAKAYRDRVKQTEQQIVAIELLSSAERKQAKNVEKRTRLEQQLQSQLSKAAETGYLDFVASSRRETIKLAEIFNSTDQSIKSFNKRLSLLDENFGKLPNTAAGVKQRIAELQRQLSNTEPGQRYANLTVEIANKQRELQQILTGTADAYDKVAAAQDRSTRVAQKLADLQEYQRSSGRIAPGSGGYLDPETGARIARGQGQIADRAAYRKRGETFAERVVSTAERLAVIPALPMAGTTTAPGTGALMSGLARPEIAKEARRGTSTGERPDQPARGFLGDAQAIAARRAIGPVQPGPSGQAYISQVEAIRKNAEAKEAAARVEENYRAEISKATAANNGSINSTNRLRSAIDAYRATLPSTSKEFKDLTSQINDLDRQSERVSRRMRRRRMSGMQMTQAAGAVLSGGIFGGPEGFLGGAIGAVGGVGGAFAGAAIGAQVGGIRRTLGEYADYAAQIARLQIALQGISGSQDQYNRALAAAAGVTSSLNVPQEVAIQGMTRLTAAVKGAGGGVADAELAFKNINSAIIATGGGAEQVQGAVTALVQIFSKGKVSAEEINQIAERLPGTFNKIAAASGRTGPELTKALQDGKVGLNDLMKFLISLGGEYGELANKIAGSSENAGARLQIAYNNMRIEVGDALQPIGAEFQDAFTEFIEDITPALVAVLPKIGKLAVDLSKGLDSLAAAAAGAAAAMGVLAIASVKVAGTAGLGVLGVAMMKVVAVAGKLTGLLKGLALINPYIALGAGAAVLVTQLFKSARAQSELNRIIEEGKGTNSEMKKTIEDLEEKYKTARNRLKGYAGETKATGRASKALRKEVIELKEQLEKLKGTYEIRLKIKRETDALMRGDLITPQMKAQGYEQKSGRLVQTVSGITYDIKTGEKYDPKKHKGLSDFESDKPDESTSTSTSDADKIQKKIEQAEKRVRDMMLRANRDFQDINLEYQAVGADEVIKIAFEREKAHLAAKRASEDAIEQIKEQSEITGRAYEKEIAFIDTIKKARIGLANSQEDDQLFNLRLSRLGTNRESFDRMSKAYTNLDQQQFPTGIESILNPSKISVEINALKDSLKELADPVNQVVGAAKTIGTAFSQSFTDAISGSKSAKEALADFFESVGSYFLDMAGQIIAKMITISILNSIAKVLPGSAGGSGFNLEGFGNIFGADSGIPGGIDFINSPNLGIGYRANGGPVIEGQPYVVGERGPEIMIPFQSGTVIPNEQSKELMAPAFQRGSEATRQQLTQQQNNRVTNSTRLDMRFESTVINSVEYVTAEQHRQGMAQAAEQGRALTLSALQNSVKARKKVGI